MARRRDEIDFEQYYEDWRHRDNLTWQIVAVAISGVIIVGGYQAGLPWPIAALVFGLGAFFMATLTMMLAQNLYYQWRDEKHLEDYGRWKSIKPQSRPIPSMVEEEIVKNSLCDKLRRILGRRRMGATLLLFTCFLFYVGFSCLFASVWQWCNWLYWVGGISVLVITFLISFGWFLIWLKRIEKEQ